MKCTKFICTALAVFCWAASVQAGVLVNDTWLDGESATPASPTYSENGVDGDSDGNLESIWYRGGAGTLAPVGLGGPLRGAGYAGSSASWTTYFTPEVSPVTLLAAGDAIKVTWVFTTGDVNATNGSQNFRFALLDSATRLTANGSPSGTATGYGIFGNMGETFGHADPFELATRTGQGAILSGTGDWGLASSLADPGASGNVGYADNTQYTMVWTVTRNLGGNHDISVSMTGGNINSAGSITAAALNVAPNGGSHSFDTFTLRPSSAATTSSQFDTNLFKVEFIPAVPEPASLGLLGLSALAMVLRRQR